MALILSIATKEVFGLRSKNRAIPSFESSISLNPMFLQLIQSGKLFHNRGLSFCVFAYYTLSFFISILNLFYLLLNRTRLKLCIDLENNTLYKIKVLIYDVVIGNV